VITVRALRWGILKWAQCNYKGCYKGREVVSVKGQRRRLTVEVELGIMESHEPRNGDML
jgi:hypothetical protein